MTRILLTSSLFVGLLLLSTLAAIGQPIEYFAYWNFNNTAQLTTPTVSATGASLTCTLAPATLSEVLSGTGQNFASSNALNGDIAGSHLRLNYPIGSALNFTVPTVGYSQVVVKYETRRSGSGSGTQNISYSIDGSTYIPFSTLQVVDGVPAINTLDFSAIAAVNENSNFRIRIEFEMGTGGVEGNNRFDNVTVSGINNNPPVDPNVDLVFPANGAVQAVLKPVFRWAANAAPYTLQVSTSSTFSGLSIDAGNILATKYVHTSNLLTNTLYYWRVGVLVNGELIFSPTFSFRTHGSVTAGAISYFGLEARNNTGKIHETIVGDILTDNSIVGIIPGGISNFNLVPTFLAGGVDSVVVNGRAQESQWTVGDFSAPAVYSLYSGGAVLRQYTVRLVNTNLPVIYVNTQNAAPILNRDDYVAANIRVIKTDGTVDVNTGTEIRGRGNSTWNMPKKPYRLKLNNAASIFNYPSDRDWVLLANYSDKTLMRTSLGFATSAEFGLEYSPRSTPVELILNGVYQGSYLFGEHMKVAPGRVNVTEMSDSDDAGDNLTGGYFLEWDDRLDEVFWFRTSRGNPLTMKSPEEPTTNQYNYIKNYVQEMEDALFSPTFGDPVNGYAKYIDVETFIKWYWVMELFKNNDARGFASIFYYKERNQKLKMGPVWDFDISAGNINYSNNNIPTGWWIRGGPWFSRFFQDPAFQRAAYNYWNMHRNTMASMLMSKIDEYAAVLNLSQQQNFRKWDILGTYVWPNAVVTGSYQGEITYLKSFLQARIDWINSQIDPNPPAKVTPSLTWFPPSAISADTPLTSTHLNATASAGEISVPGQFVYSPPAGTVLPIGANPLQVTFTPADAATYEVANASASITVAASAPAFYRAINLNGPALQIDGYNWEASSTAPGFSSTGTSAFTSQTVSLVPSTDPNRSFMIRSSIWGTNATVSLGSMPAGSYHVYLYVWEDNAPTTFTVRLEGNVVQSNYNSGAQGSWARLGPYAINVSDGSLTLNVTGTAPNLSGLEIWSVSALPPAVSAPLVDQVATVGSAFSYNLPAGSFSGQNLSYSATLANGSVLPSWIAFDAATRTFSGTPAVSDLGPSAVRVTATNAQGSASDDFNITVNAAPVMPVLAVPLTDQNVNAGSPISYVIPESSFTGSPLNYSAALSNGSALPAWLTFTPSTRTFSGTPAAFNLGTLSIRVTVTNGAGSANDVFDIAVNGTGVPVFYRAINLNGPALLIDGNNWEAFNAATGFSTTGTSLFANQAISLVPGTDANRTNMIRSSMWGSNATLSLGLMQPGSYQVYLYVWEDNSPATYTIRMEGAIVQANYNSGTQGTWARLGPYNVSVTDGTLTVNANGGDANLSGLEIWTQGTTSPTVTTPLVDQVTTVGSAFNYAFAAGTFSGGGLTYSAALELGGSLPTWLTFTPATRTFSGTPPPESVGSINVRVTATNGSGSANDVFQILVNPPLGPAVAIPLVDQVATIGTPFTYSFGAGTFSGGGLTYTAALSAGGVLPSWLTFTASTRTFTGTPPPESVGPIDVRVTATNLGGAADDVFQLLINPPAAPALAIPLLDQVATVGTPFSYVFGAGTFNGGGLTYAAALSAGGVLPSWLTFTASTRTFTGTPPPESVGPIDVRVTATNLGGSADDVFQLLINPISAPALAIPLADQVATIGTAFNYTYGSGTFSGGNLTYTAALSAGGALPLWLTYVPATRTFSGTPPVGSAGPLDIRVTATNSSGSADDVFTITINAAPVGPTFYRAINLNGPAIVLDGNNWQASASAPGFSATNAGSFSNQAITLSPATDATRANMIRSSLWGRNIGLSLGSVPSGSYQIFLYVWEDNAAQIFSVSMEGSVVQANYNTGPGGRWAKLGPFNVNVTDGTLNVSASGGDANLSGLEVWAQSPTPPQPPILSLPILDQTATEGAAFNFTFATGTFTGIGVSYSASLAAGGSIPSWLTFNAATRTFTGTPPSGSAGPIDVRVTATNSAGSIDDVFRITVSPPQPPVLLSPLVDQVATIGAVFNYAFGSGTFSGGGLVYTAALSAGGSLPLWLTFAPATRTFSGTPPAGSAGPIDIRVTATNSSGSADDVFTITVNDAPVGPTFYRAINLNGPAIVLDGNNWEASASAPGFGTTNARSFSNQTITLSPATDATRATMIRSSLWGRNIGLSLGSVPSGSYQIYLYVWEDNFAQVFSVSMEGSVVQSNYNTGPGGRWAKLGPFNVNVTDGTLNVLASGEDANLSGLEVWRQNSGGGGAARLAITSPGEAADADTEEVDATGYPNPFSSFINVKFTARENGDADLVVFDTRGIQVHNHHLDEVVKGNTEEVHLELAPGLPNGMYFIKLINGKYVRYLRVSQMK